MTDARGAVAAYRPAVMTDARAQWLPTVLR